MIEIWHVWVIAAILFFIAEIFSPVFVSLCFGVACLICSPFAYFHFDFRIQLAVFSLSALVIFFVIRPVFMKWFHRTTPSAPKIETNANALIGKMGVVLERIDPHTVQGRVKVQGEDWRGFSVNSQPIDPNVRVVVVGIDGTKLLVRPITEGES